MKKTLSILAIVVLSALVSSCASSGAYTHGGGHSSCAAYGNP
jgi:hypothetical protein